MSQDPPPASTTATVAPPEALAAVRDGARSPFGISVDRHPAVLDLSASPGIQFVGAFSGLTYGSPLTAWPPLVALILVGVGALLRDRRRLSASVSAA